MLVLTGISKKVLIPLMYSEISPRAEKPNGKLSVNDALLQTLASGPMARKDILPAIEALRPGTTGQTVSSALNGLQKAKKVKLQKNGTWIAL